MKRTSLLTIALAATTALTTAAWAQHGGGVGGGHDGAGSHGGPPSFAADGSHGSNGSSHDANTNTGSGHAADFATRLENNTNLSSRLQNLLPAGETLSVAAMGFKNQGQFIAALHVSQNLNIPFDTLKMQMLTNHESLGAAIHALKPDLTSKTVNTDVKDAERQAKTDVQDSNEVAENSGK